QGSDTTAALLFVMHSLRQLPPNATYPLSLHDALPIWAATISGDRPMATIDQRKNAIENGGTEPATPRAKIMLETCAVDNTRKPSRPRVSRALPDFRSIT